jgi:hypothetical protein
VCGHRDNLREHRLREHRDHRDERDPPDDGARANAQ